MELKTVNTTEVEHILHYSEYLEDKQFQDKKGNFIRYRLIYFNNNLYTHYMVNGKVMELKMIDEEK